MKLVAKNLTKTYEAFGQQNPVLRGIDVAFKRGESYAITGASGSGKSTLMHLLGGLDQPTEGSVWFGEHDLAQFSRVQKEKFLNQSVGFVFQFHYLIYELTVLENVMLPGLIAGQTHITARAQAAALVEHVGLGHKHTMLPAQLSGGEQQRVAIARALFNRPQFILADEPTGNLDAANAALIVDLFIRYQQEHGVGLIICSHDSAVYERMKIVYELAEGVLCDRSLAKAYKTS